MRRFSILSALVAAFALILAHAASAATITVNTTTDETSTDGKVSLREAIQSINAGANVNGDVAAVGAYGSNDTIVLPPSAIHFAVSTGELSITKSVVIQGAGPASSVVDPAGMSRAFHITSGVGNSGTVTFQNLAITGGHVTTGPGGGGVLTDIGSGFLQLLNLSVTGNSVNVPAGGSQGGGGVYTRGNVLTVTNSTFNSNTVTSAATTSGNDGGGAIYDNNSDIHISNSTLSANTATINGNGGSSGANGGGAIYSGGGGLFASGDTFTGNAVTVTNTSSGVNGGGAIYGDSTSGSNMGISLTSSVVGGAGPAGNTATLGTSGTPLTGSNDGGGGIFNNSGNILITASTVSGNTTTVFAGGVCCNGGGGLYQDSGDTTFTSAVVSGNTASVSASSGQDGGGGFYNNSGNSLSIATSFTGNSTTLSAAGNADGGGGYYQDTGIDTLTSSTVSGNSVHFAAAPTSSGGGGIFEDNSGSFLTNSTISDNSTDVPAGTNPGGGGIYLDNNGTNVFASVTIAGNSTSHAPGGGVLNFGATLRSTDTIIAQNSAFTGGANCGSAGTSVFNSLGYNLEDAANTCHFTAAGDIVTLGATVGLGPLQNNGGPTATRALLAGSPAIEGGNPSGCVDAFFVALPADQRGLMRPDRCDIGAYEFAAPINTSLPVISGLSAPGQTLACSAGTWSGSPILSFAFQWNRDAKPIAGANGSTYPVAAGDAGHQLTCTVTTTNTDGSASATSAAQPVLTPASAVACLNPAKPAVDLLAGPLRVGVRSHTFNVTLRNRNACLIVGNARLKFGTNALPGVAFWMSANSNKTLSLLANKALLRKLNANRLHRVNGTMELTLLDASGHKAAVNRSYRIQAGKTTKRRARRHR